MIIEQKSDQKAKLTFIEHREVGAVDGKQMQVGWELWHQLDQGVVDNLVRVAEPTRELASLRWGKKELE